MRYDNKQEVASWLRAVERDNYNFGGREIKGKQMRSEIEKLLDREKPEVFLPDAYFDAATLHFCPEYFESLHDSLNRRFNSD